MNTSNFNFFNLRENKLTEEQYNAIFLTRTIVSVISCFFCLVIITLYIKLVLQVKCWKEKVISERESESEQVIEEDNKREDTKVSKIGLGSNFMFFLVLSNFLGSISYIFLYFISEKDVSNIHKYCQCFSFFHYFFDLSAVGWTSFITNLFLKSTKVNHFTDEEERTQLKLGSLYSFGFAIVLSLLPYINSSYGSANTHCSFDYEKKYKWICWAVLIILFIFANIFYNIYCLCKVGRYYKNKLKELGANQKKEKRIIRIFVIIFYSFSIMLIISRGCKGLNRLSIWLDENYLRLALCLEYLNSIVFCLNGSFNSILCFYFFRGAFNCPCHSKKESIISANTLILLPEKEEDSTKEREEE